MPRLKPPTKEESQLLPAYAVLPDSAIYVPQTPAEFDAARTAMLQHTALGFDTESKPIFHTSQVDHGPHVVQLATPHAAWILQLYRPEALVLAREIMGNPRIAKVGFGLDNDKATLPKRLGAELTNVVDLDRIFQQHGYGASTGIRAAVALVLGQSFHKSKKQSTSNWALPHLSTAQIRYAANDAHGPAMVYASLPAWQAAQPAIAPQRPTRAHRAPRPASVDNTPRPTRAALFQAPNSNT